ncbi:MAG TPA: DGQHR domain-containing protein [Phycisphaerae bacterium]|nr:DGQHR domain-containing protein [Phycisphaerae bacterium]
MNEQPSNLFPALRSRMGDRWFYVTTLTFAEVAKWIRQVDEIHERKELKTWIQRVLRPERKEEIATYLIKQKQHFFNAVVVGIYGGEPEWFPVEVGSSKTLKDIKLDERQANTFGFLHLSGNEEIFAVDGQHRVDGIKEALKRNVELKEDELVVIFVSHKRTDEGRERTRRLFTTLNKYAKPVSPAELIALNDDDAFAIVTRRLIDTYQGLNGEFVPLSPTANIPPGNLTSVTTVIALYELVRTISIATGSRERKVLEVGPPNWQRVEEINDFVISYWNALKQNIPPLAKVMSSPPRAALAGRYRTENGGHLLFRPAGLQAFTRAVRVMIDRGTSVDSAVMKLAKVQLNLSSNPLVGVLWNAATKTMIVKYKKLALNLLLYMANQDPAPTNYNVVEEYRRVLGDAHARIKRR